MTRTKVLAMSIVTLIMFSVTAMSMGAPVEGKDISAVDRELGEELVSRVIDAYENFTISGFLAVVSNDYAPDRMQLANSVAESYYDSIVLGMDHFMDKVSREGDTIALGFKWQKTVQDKDAGNSVMTEGVSTFVFKKEKGEWKLTRLLGDNPFL
ncbi:MAG: hypothetical protein PHH49_02835 [Candidatus Omnitrophica bacterium]|nr:hypothetical protein [Candidatus Omnitrophota bacterium]MDD5487885.1 hypothetical protein [Candidatus Omnitrophota bacterium]